MVVESKFEYARALYEGLHILALMYGSESMIYREKERSWIRVVCIDDLYYMFLGYKGNGENNKFVVRDLCGIKKGC